MKYLLKKMYNLQISFFTFLILCIFFYFSSASYFDKAIWFNNKSSLNNFNYMKSIDLFNKTTSKTNDLLTKVQGFLQLGRLYQRGTSSKFINNKLIPGIKPDLDKSVYYFNEAIKLGSWMGYLELAKLYHYESQSKYYSKSKAKQILDYIIWNLTSDINSKNYDNIYDISGESKFNILANSKNESIVLTNSNTNLFFPKLLVQKPKVIPKIKRKSLFRANKKKNNDKLNNTLNNNDNIDDLDLNTILTLINLDTDPNVDEVTNEIPNNFHNTHDHVVVQTVKNSVNNLQQHTNIIQDIPTSLIEIRNIIQNFDETKIPSKQKNMAIRTLDSIEKNNIDISSIGLKEAEILNLVWNRLKMPELDSSKDDLIENLIRELSESVEHGNVMCATGRTNRIVDSLNIVDPLVNIKPKWAINREMMEKAAKIRENLEENLNEFQKSALSSSNPSKDQQQFIDDFDSSFKQTLRNTFKTDYVDTGVIQQSILDNELDKWINDI